jgi:hypothetical protein
MDKNTAINKLRELAETIPDRPLSSEDEFVKPPEKYPPPITERIEAIRKSIEDMSESMGVKVGPDSLAVPIPVELLQEMVRRLVSLEERVPPAVEFLPHE